MPNQRLPDCSHRILRNNLITCDDDHAFRLLLSNKKPIEAIYLRMPYESVAHVKHLFRKIVDMTMSEWLG